MGTTALFSWPDDPAAAGFAVALACAAALLAGILVAWSYRRAQARRVQAWAEDDAESARMLAAERQRALLVPQLEAALRRDAATIETLRAARSVAEQAAAVLREALAQERRRADEKLALLEEARARMTQEFRVLADEVLRGHGREFGERNREQIDALLRPMREQIGEYQRSLGESRLETARERAALGEQVRALSEASATMTAETAGLARALRGQVQMQGAWGEMVLATVLQRAGLREGEEYEAQSQATGQDGQRLRPDVVVNLPGGGRLVVDAKMSLLAFEGYVNAEADDERARLLAAHAGAMRAHVRGLGEKGYPAAVEGALDYVVMFVPIEGALAAALQEAPDLPVLAAERNVAIATPTTLMIALRTVANVWRVDRRHRHAEEIARRAGALYDKFAAFVDDLLAVGMRLDQARLAHEDALAKLSRGRGNLVRQVEQLRELGASARAAIAPAVLDADAPGEAAAED